MSYTNLDPVISAWAADNQLTVYTEYQDIEVRSVDFACNSGKRFQIWIDQPNNNRVEVHAWDYKKRQQKWAGSIHELRLFLNDAISTVKSWGSS